MSRPALPPAQIIEAARQRLAKATSAEGIRFEEHIAIGSLMLQHEPQNALAMLTVHSG